MSINVNLDHPLNTFEDAYEYLCECIEKGYSYSGSIHEVTMHYNLDNTRIAKLKELMHSDDINPDKLRVDLENIIL